MRCEDLMVAEVVTARGDETIRDVAKTMRDQNIGFVPICADDGSPLGTVTDRDIVVRVVADGFDGKTPVRDIMSTELVWCSPADNVRRVEELMRVNQKNRILVVDDAGRLAGVISVSDLLHYDDPRRAGELASDITDREVGAH